MRHPHRRVHRCDLDLSLFGGRDRLRRGVTEADADSKIKKGAGDHEHPAARDHGPVCEQRHNAGEQEAVIRHDRQGLLKVRADVTKKRAHRARHSGRQRGRGGV